MRAHDPEAALVVGASMPPYHDVEQFSEVGRLARGTLLVIDLPSVTPDGVMLERMVGMLRTRHPAAPVIVRVREITSQTLQLAHRTSRIGVRAVVGRDDRLADALRPLLTRPDDLAGDLLEWVQLRGRAFSPRITALVRRVVELAPRYPHVGDLLHAAGESERTARHLFRGAGIPRLRQWHQGSRALHAAMRLQERPEARIQALALELGYSDHSGLARQVTRAFGVTPAGIRGTLGWEWLAERWMTRNKLQR